MKDIEAIFFEIEINQIKEEELKGTLNRDLYLFMYDVNGRVARKSYWKKFNRNMLTEFVEHAVNDTTIEKVTISNNYSDWEVEVLLKV